MMTLHPGFTGIEQLLALFGWQGLQSRVRRVSELRQLLAEISGKWLLEVLL